MCVWIFLSESHNKTTTKIDEIYSGCWFNVLVFVNNSPYVMLVQVYSNEELFKWMHKYIYRTHTNTNSLIHSLMNANTNKQTTTTTKPQRICTCTYSWQLHVRARTKTNLCMDDFWHFSSFHLCVRTHWQKQQRQQQRCSGAVL